MLAAERIVRKVHPKDCVVLATGFACPPWFNIGEQDGPVGAATLARALMLGLGARPVFVTDDFNVGLVTAAAHGAGLRTDNSERAASLPRVSSVLNFPLNKEEAIKASSRMLRELNPAALIAIERPSQNSKGEYHGLTGINITKYVSKLDCLFEDSKHEKRLTIGIGDGGNELGYGLIRDSVIRYVPFAGDCKCGCGGGVASNTTTEVLVPATVSNWGAYGIEACIAALLENEALIHTRSIDNRTHEWCAQAGAINAGPGLLDPGADDVPAEQHGDLVELLRLIVQKSFMTGQEYKYDWLSPSKR